MWSGGGGGWGVGVEEPGWLKHESIYPLILVTDSDNDLTASLLSLNSNPRLDNSQIMNNLLHTEDSTNTFININLKTSFYDMEKMISSYKHSKIPLLLSTNIQSLQSKFQELKNFIIMLLNNNVQISAIALQEIWQINHPDQLE